jgi:sulfane dehydrogenase subunit SoxC
MTRSLPLERILERALVVYAQNGERLRPENGYPLRLIVPGFEGNTNVKWLRRLKVVDAPLQTREETSKYTSLLANGTARQFAFEMDAKSVITRPSPGHRLTTHGYYAISGHGLVRARHDPQGRGLDRWRRRRGALARLVGAIHDRALTRFEADWRWDGGAAAILSRATDSTGYVQPTRARTRRRARAEFSVPLQRDPAVARGRERRGAQCVRGFPIHAMRVRAVAAGADGADVVFIGEARRAQR